MTEVIATDARSAVCFVTAVASAAADCGQCQLAAVNPTSAPKQFGLPVLGRFPDAPKRQEEAISERVRLMASPKWPQGGRHPFTSAINRILTFFDAV